MLRSDIYLLLSLTRCLFTVSAIRSLPQRLEGTQWHFTCWPQLSGSNELGNSIYTKQTQAEHFVDSERFGPDYIGDVESCEAALDLIPRSFYHPGDPDLHEKYFANAPKYLSVSIEGKHLITGPEKIRLPAIFWSMDCLIAVSSLSSSTPRPGFRAATMLHDWLWPSIRFGVQKILKECPRSAILGDLGSRGRTQQHGMQFGFSVHSAVAMENAIVDAIRRNKTGQTFPWSRYNIYITNAQVNDVRWPIPFREPSSMPDRHGNYNPAPNSAWFSYRLAE